jgi:hypothetical protein
MKTPVDMGWSETPVAVVEAARVWLLRGGYTDRQAIPMIERALRTTPRAFRSVGEMMTWIFRPWAFDEDTYSPDS